MKKFVQKLLLDIKNKHKENITLRSFNGDSILLQTDI